jgi:hypothetical protein
MINQYLINWNDTNKSFEVVKEKIKSIHFIYQGNTTTEITEMHIVQLNLNASNARYNINGFDITHLTPYSNNKQGWIYKNSGGHIIEGKVEVEISKFQWWIPSLQIGIKKVVITTETID